MGYSDLTVYTDGASRGNPGQAGIGLAFFDSEGNEVAHHKRYIGLATNNVAEYTALLEALEQALTLGANNLRIFSDSELMVRQLNGEYRVKDDKLQSLYGEAVRKMKLFSSVRVEHIRRTGNKRADQLANEAIDAADADAMSK